MVVNANFIMIIRGIGFPITNDQEVIDYLDSMRIQLFLAMQTEGCK